MADDDDDDSVGYRKPPKATRFKKGQSGNPLGRPRKPKPPQFKLSAGTFDQNFEREMARVVRMVENGKTTEMNTAEALQRAQVVKALQGNRLAQERVLEKLEAKEREKLQEKKECFELFEKLKERSSDLLADFKKKGLPPPDLIPHPDEIELRYDTYDVIFHGPVTPEEDQNWKRVAKLRDYFMRRAARECKGVNFVREQDGRTQMNLAYYLGQLFDAPPLPRRYRWTHDREVVVAMSANVSKREWEKQLAADHAWIDAEERLFPSFVTPEMVTLLKRFYKDRVADIWFDLPSGITKKGPKLVAA